MIPMQPTTLKRSEPKTGKMQVFLITWFGQVVSLVGSGLTGFALGVYVYQRTGSATLFAFIGLFAVLPRVLFSPVAGSLVDRWDRRKVMILADVGAGVSTLVVAVLLYTDRLDLWHIYAATAAGSFFGTFQWPAYTAAVSQLVPKVHLGRANGMNQFGRAAAEILAPSLAGVLVLSIGLEGVILIDVATFLFAVLALMLVDFPPVERKTGGNTLVDFRNDLTFGWKYILVRRGLFSLLLFQTGVNFIWGMVGALIVPMILSFTSADQLGFIITIAGVGMFAGSLLMVAWGGPKRRIEGIVTFEALSGVCFLLMGFRPNFWPIAVGAFGAHLTIAIVLGSNQSLWQTKVAHEAQGRVFAAQQMFAKAVSPLAYLAAGPLAEKVFEPLMGSGGSLNLGLSWIVGLGSGRGIGLMFLLMGLAKIILALLAYLNPRVRKLDAELPDAV